MTKESIDYANPLKTSISKSQITKVLNDIAQMKDLLSDNTIIVYNLCAEFENYEQEVKQQIQNLLITEARDEYGLELRPCTNYHGEVELFIFHVFKI